MKCKYSHECPGWVNGEKIWSHLGNKMCLHLGEKKDGKYTVSCCILGHKIKRKRCWHEM